MRAATNLDICVRGLLAPDMSTLKLVFFDQIMIEGNLWLDKSSPCCFNCMVFFGEGIPCRGKCHVKVLFFQESFSWLIACFNFPKIIGNVPPPLRISPRARMKPVTGHQPRLR